MKGKIYLVGAGPGDAGLITQKAVECLAIADVVIYDRLINPELLSYAPKEARLLYAGKGPDNHVMSQQDINQLLVQEALDGHTVVRLKGGDPFMFGRGGEEAMALHERHIPYEIVPGITSAVAVPAYAGIPVTYRGLASSLHIITGHEDPAKPDSAIDWEALARLNGTLVFLMGIENLEEICRCLIQYGKDEQTPAAVIERGTTARQRTITSILADINQKAKQVDIHSPAIIIVGSVVSLRRHLAWYENMPLFGKKVMVTRAEGQQDRLIKKLSHLGAEAIRFPVIAILPPGDYDLLDQAIRSITRYQWLIFTSANGVEYFFHRLEHYGLDSRHLANIKVCAIGGGTAGALKQRGIIADYMPRNFSTDAVAAGLKDKIKPGMRLLLPCSDIADDGIKKVLETADAAVDMVTAYRTVPNMQDSRRLSDMLTDDDIDIITFTSSSTVHNFIKILGSDNLQLLDGVELASIGPITSAALRRYGLRVSIQAGIYTIDGLIKAIEEDRSDGSIA